MAQTPRREQWAGSAGLGTPGGEEQRHALGHTARGRLDDDRAIEIFRQAPGYASGAYLIAPFKKPEDVIPLIDEALE